MKLNVKRTVLTGLAFLSICTFWQMYDFTVPLILKYYFAVGDTLAGVVMAMDNVLALFMLPLFGALSDRCHLSMGRRMPFILWGTLAAALLTACLPLVIAQNNLLLFFLVLGLLLIAMGTYRSPAVALMPDLTPKPLRSKGNAIINLMGAVGGVLALGLIQVAVVKTVHPVTGEPLSDYRYLFWAVALIMILSVAILKMTIDERSMALSSGSEESDISSGGISSLAPEVRRSMLLILFSVFFWFMGYNAVISAFSKYAISSWGATEGAAARCVMIASVAAIASYLPVGIVSSRYGRKRVIQFGVVLLAICYACVGFFHQMAGLIYLFFCLVGLAWAAINVNSFPMVVELSSGSDTGRYTGYYYTFSMAAQVVTPILSGWLLRHVSYYTLFPYAALFVAGSFVTMLFVRHGDVKAEAKTGLAAFEDMDT